MRNLLERLKVNRIIRIYLQRKGSVILSKILIVAAHFVMLHPIRTELIQRLLDDGHQVYLSLPPSEKNSFFSEMGCNIVESPIDRRGMNPIKDIRLIIHYFNDIKSIDPDFILSFSIKPNAYTGLVLRFLKKQNGAAYKQICNITGTGGTFLKKSVFSEFCKLLYRFSIKNAYLMLFQNRSDKDFFASNGMIAKNWDIIPGSGVNLDIHKFSSMPDDKEISFIFIARLLKIKGVDEFLLAAKKLKSRFPNVRFIVAGMYENKQYKQIIEQNQKMGIIDYLGFVDDIYNWIEKSHCTVLPSYGGEGVPNVLMESAAKGRACIGSDIPGTRDVIEDGINGYLVKPKDVNDLIEKMIRFIQLTYPEKQHMGEQGRKKVEKEFDRQIVVERYIKEIEGR